MSIHLVGGGRDDEYDGEVYRVFIEEATVRAAATGRDLARIGVLLVGGGDDAAEYSASYTQQLLRTADCEPTVSWVDEGEHFASAVLTGIDGLLIGGGHTPSYLTAVEPIIGEIRFLVSDNLPYLGFSAGAMIAADRAIIGGWMVGDVPVAPEETGEDLEEVTIAEGIGLVDLAIDVHAASGARSRASLQPRRPVSSTAESRSTSSRCSSSVTAS